ncbi:tripartite tricarboxylate transporter TctB family protein [Celeribacter sp. PS-C1]|uniref:tripartite tricarboxylate transporter TctB family protein n=1 Tax=Celeribacter sp. PS-C1 TaxID=2820813 RepID=UPI001C67FFBD|nr:tripartite tricarboxylate transporter TctB family protein [Celeribacter sp. PS-C1]MBW6419338.1 tripartite tricarboxylate transporter TctB family protein [Celeribacter sp. PS-C1]
MSDTRKRDLLFCAMAIAAALIVLIASFSYQSASAYFPRLLTIFVALLALALGVERYRSEPNVERADGTGNDELWAFLKIVASILAYVGAMLLIGFTAATVLFLTAMMTMLGARNLVILVPVALGLTGLLVFLFFWFLGVSPPEALVSF